MLRPQGSAMRLLDGKKSSAALRADVAKAAEFLARRRIRPCLAAILVGRHPASESYVAGKRRAAEGCGIVTELHRLPGSTTPQKLNALIGKLNRNKSVHGILLQLPLPDHLDEDAAIRRIDPAKDIDGLHPENLGLLASGRPRFVPCTPRGVVHLLDYYKIPLEGRRAVIVGRSRLVGKPLALLLILRHATVTVCHSRTRNLAEVTRQADVLIAAAGKRHLIRQVLPNGQTMVKE